MEFNLNLTAEEHELLLSILGERHRELMNEIWHTDHREFKERLKKQEKVLESLVHRVQTLQPSVAMG